MSAAQSGEKSHTAKLTWVQVRQIRELKKTTTIYKLAESFKVSPENISMIVNNKRWKEN